MKRDHSLLPSFWLSLGIWLAAGIVAVALATSAGPEAGLIAAIAGGVAFGVFGARRLDGRRTRVRHRRQPPGV